ncbi:TetR/AcrR family transcriptional regulator [Bradyrhizobium archetypum]|uniref:TetR/AcrR family transcriptional regulator n=1 Tax=Bradyrhizobium archetypum TaxID=2721160 RepID=A0A7Y4M5C3_9BRAD|nr:TetR/AcrR family transcriptional regulator [Bradyrhizobium archetypum]NOJ49950.1 TetR/AcrR family transcriptional regulator [Bradyrhizobium archetypum]
MPAIPKHRQPIINAAVTLFRRQGYSRTGLNDIVDVSGAPKGSLYHYFPLGKSSIAVAAVEEAGRRVATTIEALAKECRSTGDLLRAHARLLAGWMRGSGFRNGCPITTVLLELAPRERAVAEAGRKAYAARVAILSDKLVADGHPKARAEALAVLCTSAMQGALIQARVERSGRPIEVTAAELARLLEERPAGV